MAKGFKYKVRSYGIDTSENIQEYTQSKELRHGIQRSYKLLEIIGEVVTLITKSLDSLAYVTKVVRNKVVEVISEKNFIIVKVYKML